MKSIVTCEICGHKAKVLTMHLKHTHKISKKEYLKDYPTAVIVSETVREQNRKRMSGKNNPQYGKGSSANSPFSIEFYIKKYPNKNNNEVKELLQQFLQTHKKSAKQNVFCIEYWLSKGYNNEDALIEREKIRFKRTISHIMESQSVSKEEAIKIQQNINIKWQNTLNNKKDIININKSKGRTFEQLKHQFGIEKATNIIKARIQSKHTNVQFWSDASKLFFDKVIVDLNLNHYNIKRDNNEYCIVDKDYTKLYYYDYCDLDNNIIIEYNGTKFHPKDPNSTTWKQLYTSEEAQIVFNKDNRKKQIAENNGFDVITIWDDDSYEINLNKIKKGYING